MYLGHAAGATAPALLLKHCHSQGCNRLLLMMLPAQLAPLLFLWLLVAASLFAGLVAVAVTAAAAVA
jgi:hypothetical protein